MRIKYISKRLRAASLARVIHANEIIDEYARQGYRLTLRQLYYQFVARGMIPNNQKSYKQLGELISDARLLGLIDWDHIDDRTRFVRSMSSWKGVPNILDSCRSSYHLDRWENQRSYVEVWIEKDALVGVFEPICQELDLPLLSCRGYTSQSEMWAAGQRINGQTERGKDAIVFHFGDHDPSGLDMTRDIDYRLRMFTAPRGVHIERLALTMEQIGQYECPPNPAKVSDSRAARYIEEYGHESWELDALEPGVLAQLVRDHVEPLIDREAWAVIEEREENERQQLTSLAGNWEAVMDWLHRERDDEAE